LPTLYILGIDILIYEWVIPHRRRKMELVYVCIANGTNKDTKKPYSRFVKVTEGNGYSYLDIKSSIYESEIVPLFTKRIFKN